MPPKEPLFKDVGYFADKGPEGEVEVAWQWNTGYNEGLHSYANGISTTEGGMHAEGFKRALTHAINRYAKARNLVKAKDTAFQGDDVREGLTAIVSVRFADPQFEGQTKAKLGNTEIRSLVERATNEHFGRWLEEHPNPAKAIVAKATNAAKARSAAKQARELTRRKTALDGVGMPDKLADCAARGRDDTELFIVEGDSAGGSARDARDPKNQAILPLRGKILNVERASMDKIVANTEIQSLIAAIGAGIGTDFDVAKVRYGKVVILADADVDGGHIRTLLITFFYRQMMAAGRKRPALRRAAAAVSRSRSAARRSTSPTRRPGCALVEANQNRQLAVRALQGSRRDGPARAARDVHGSRDAPPRPHRRRPGRDRRRDPLDPDGRRRRRPPHLDPEKRQRRPLPRRVEETNAEPYRRGVSRERRGQRRPEWTPERRT